MDHAKIPSILDLPLPSNMFAKEKESPILSGIPTLSGEKLKGAWSASEDELLKSAVAARSQPYMWDEIAILVPGRTSKQCRERWLFRLCPDVNKAPFERCEDELIVIERAKIGNHWTAIAAKLPGRTSCAIKNRWYTVLRNRIGPVTNNKIMCKTTINPMNQYFPPQYIPQFA